MIARTPSTLFRTSILLLLVSAPLHAADPIPAVPPGDGQITRPVTSFPDSATPGRTFFGQQTITGKLVLTASNGFFDSGIRAVGQSAVKDAAGVEFIGPDFEYLNQWHKPATTLCWHLWIARPGKLFINSHLEVDPADAGSKSDYSLGGTHVGLATRAESNPQASSGAGHGTSGTALQGDPSGTPAGCNLKTRTKTAEIHEPNDDPHSPPPPDKLSCLVIHRLRHRGRS